MGGSSGSRREGRVVGEGGVGGEDEQGVGYGGTSGSRREGGE